MRLSLLATGLVCLPLLSGGLLTSADALTAMDFPAERIQENHAQPELILEQDGIVPGGTTWIAVRFRIEDGWHLYWNGRNESGSPPSFTADLPKGYSLGDWIWPAPKRHVAPGDILDHIYEGSVVLMAPLKAPADAKVGDQVALKFDVDWVVCDSNMCVSESGSVEATISVKSAVAKGSDAAAFTSARLSHPKPWPTDSKNFSAAFTTKDSKTSATIRVADATTIEFYPDSNCGEINGLLKAGTVTGDTLVLPLASADASSSVNITGVVAIGRGGQDPSEFYELKLSSLKAAKQKAD